MSKRGPGRLFTSAFSELKCFPGFPLLLLGERITTSLTGTACDFRGEGLDSAKAKKQKTVVFIKEARAALGLALTVAPRC